MSVPNAMQRSVRRLLSCFVILAIAVQAAFATPIASAPIDPLSVICHSDVAGAVDEEGSKPPAAQHSCCDSCILCHVAPAANPPDQASYLILRPRPTRPALTLATEPHRAAVFHQAFARGPPSDA
jgi:hypothetical protein